MSVTRMANTRKSTVAGAALIILLTVVAYIPAMRGGFVWDDDDYITNNKALRTGNGLRQIWVNPDATVQYYPLTFTVFWAEYHLWGLHPFGFHLVNVLLQAVNAVLFWSLLSRLGVPGAWWAAAVFALHPVHVMSVAWITELKNVLSGGFFLFALLAHLRFSGLDEGCAGPQTNRKFFYGLAVGLYLCALLAKTATSIFPAAILLMLWWKKGRIGRKDLVPVLPLFAVGILFGAFTLWLERYGKGAHGQEFTLPFLERVLVAGHSFWFSLGKLVWPVRLTFIYPRWQLDATVGWQYLFPAGAIALLVTLWWTRRWIGRAPLAAVMYFALAFPALVLIQVLYMMRYTFVADHWLYLASMSIIPLCGGAVVTALDRFDIAPLRIRFMLGTVVLATLALLTWRQGAVYRNLETLWRDTLTKNPQCWLAHNNLGNVFWREGKISDALGHYEQALRLHPDYAEAQNNLGNVFWREGKISDALGHYEQALRIDPDSAEAHYNLGSVLAQTGKIGEAIAHFEQALRLKPDYAEAHENLGVALVHLGRVPEAMAQWEQALRLKPDFAEAHYNLGKAFAQTGKTGEAVAHFEQAVRLKPDYAEAYEDLGVGLVHLGRVPEAMAQWEQALRLKPDFAEAHYNLGLALARLGRLPEAIAHYEQALRIRPNYVEAHCSLGNALEQTGRLQEAMGHWEQALRDKPDYPEAQNNLAWLMATHTPAEGGDPVRAVTLAERACELTNNRVAAYLDTLAVAYAAADRFNDAIAAAQKAIGLAKAAGQSQLVEDIELHLELYRAGRAYRAPASVTSRHDP